jgi:nucleotide-binding universal stress UspA family protein
MPQFDKIGVFLNDEPGDEEALIFAGKLAERTGAVSLCCIHVRGLEQSAAGPSPRPAEVEASILAQLPAALHGRTTVEVREETGLREVLRAARDRELDLMVVGRRLPHDQMAAGSAFLRLARKAPCNVLVVPDRAIPHLGRALVLVDESDHAREALIKTIALVRASGEPNPQVIAQSVYTVNYGSRYAGLEYHEAGKNMERHARERLAPLTKIDTTGVKFELVLTCSRDVGAAAYDLASARNMDLIVVGSRGTASLPASLLGGVAERVLAGSPLPVLIVKRKGETIGFLAALLDRI